MERDLFEAFDEDEAIQLTKEKQSLMKKKQKREEKNNIIDELNVSKKQKTQLK
jgi:hypothetical protein